MRTVSSFLPPFVLLLLWSSAAFPAAAQVGSPVEASPPLAITSVTVVDVAQGTLRQAQTVLIEGDRISIVGDVDEVQIPGGAAVIDASGKYVIPGLWDMHAHTGNDRNAREIVYPLMVAHGVTGFRNMQADCLECGPNFSIEQGNARRRAVAAGELLGPSVVASSEFAGSHEQAAKRAAEGSSPEAPGTESDARAFVRLAKERGLDFIKVYDMLPREAYFALVEEANRLGLPVAGHVPVEVRASEASDAGQRSIEHPRHFNILLECSSREDDLRARLIDEFEKAEMGARHTSDGSTILPLTLEMVDTHDPEKCAALADRFVRNGTWVVPTLMTGRLPSELGGGWREDPYARFLTSEERRFFEWAEEAWSRDLGDAEQKAPASRWEREISRALHQAGVPMLAGSDAGIPGVYWGISLHQELELLVSAGFTEAEALHAATLGPAEFLEATDSLGSVESGKVADLVLLEANPLEDITNTQRISAVVLRGRYLDREALDRLLADAEEAASRSPEAAREALDGVIAGYAGGPSPSGAAVTISEAERMPESVELPTSGDPSAHAAGGQPAPLLYVWMGDVDRDPATGHLGPGQDSDFLAVYDVELESGSYGEVVATVPVGVVASMPHHTEYWMPAPGQPLFVNGHMTEDVFLFDVTDPSTPRVAGVLDRVPPLRFPHDMVALPNGNVIVGYLRSEGPSPVPGDSLVPGGHGGVAEFTRSGELIRWASAADSSLSEPVRPYSFAALPDVDRLVVTSAPMMEEHSADVVQIWRLSDLTLLHTLAVPPARLSDGTLLRTRDRRTGALEPTGHLYPFVPRVMPDASVLFNAFGCGLYRITGLDGGSPTVENVYSFTVPEEFPMGACGVPVYTGRYWVMTVGAAHALVSLDVEDPANPRRVSVLETGSDFAPHWLALDPGSHRLIVGAENGGDDRMLMARLDPATGELSWDETLSERNGFPGIDFRRASWPHGETGLAFGHAAVFGGDSVASHLAVPDTARFTIIINGHRQGERRVWQEAPDTWRYEHDGDAYHFPRTERLVLDAEGVPLVIEIDGQRILWDHWVERYERREGRGRWNARAVSSLGPEWSRSLGEGEAEVSGPAYYAALHPVHDVGVLARLLLRQADGMVPLLPDGTARLEPVGERWVDVDGMRRRIRLFAIHGLDLKPSYVWLDDDDSTFADEWSVLAEWEAAFPDLRSASDAALAEHHRRLADELVPPVRERPLVIRGARLFDPATGSTVPGTTIVVDGRHIRAVGSDETIDPPAGAEVVDAAGRTVLPGLWDMHAHHGFPGPYFELIAPLSLAGGITTARDLGMPIESMLSLQRRILVGDAVGPRILMAGWVGGARGRPTGTLVGNAAEARAAVDRFSDLGYVQIKIYSDLPHELVPVVIERAKQHGLRVSGEVPTGMTAGQAVEHGYDEIQHIDGLLLPLAADLLTEFFADPTPAGLQAVNETLAELTPESKDVRELIRLIASEGVAVDPTLTVFAAQAMEPPEWVARVAARFPAQAQRRILDRHLFGYWALTPLWDEILGNMSALVGALHDAGAPVLAGTDTEMAAFDLHRELALYVEAGIPAPEVLMLATLGAARIMGMDAELGSIEPGKLADLILVDGDPATQIDELRRVVLVVKDGRVYDPTAIHRALGIDP